MYKFSVIIPVITLGGVLALVFLIALAALVRLLENSCQNPPACNYEEIITLELYISQ